MNYYLQIIGKEHGPYTLDEIKGAIEDGDITPDQNARTEDSTMWQPLHKIAPVGQSSEQEDAELELLGAPHDEESESPAPKPCPKSAASMNPSSSLATVLIRLAAICIAVYGAYIAGCSIWFKYTIESLIARNGPPDTFTGSIFNIAFHPTSVNQLFAIQFSAGVVVVLIGMILYKVSKHLGIWIGKDLG